MAKTKDYTYHLVAISLVLMLLSKFISSYPYPILVALGPLFALISQEETSPAVVWKFIFPVFLIHNMVTWLPGDAGFWPGIVISAVLLSLPFFIYRFTNKFSKNRIGLFTIAIYWLAMEYVMLKVDPRMAAYTLAAFFDDRTDLIGWNYHTGYLGVSLWVLMANVLFYYAFFYSNAIFKGQIRWVTIALSLLLTAIPVLLLIWLDVPGVITRQDVVSVYYGQAVPGLAEYSSRGEFLGRTGAWVAVLLVIYAFVQRKVK